MGDGECSRGGETRGWGGAVSLKKKMLYLFCHAEWLCVMAKGKCSAIKRRRGMGRGQVQS